MDSPPLHRLADLGWHTSIAKEHMRYEDNIPEGIESLRSQGSSGARRQTLRDRFMEIFFDVRTLDDRSNSNRDVDLVSIRSLSPWAPLNVEKKGKSPLQTASPDPAYPPPQKKQDKRQFRWHTFLMILIILLLLGDVAFLNARVIELTNDTDGNTSSSPTPTSSNTSSSDDVEDCLSQFTLDAPSNPSAYPCATCLPVLSNVTNNTNAANALQFYGLRAILESTGTDQIYSAT